MNKQERNIIILTAEQLTLECSACCKIYYQALINKEDTWKTAYSKERYNAALSNWRKYQNKFNQVKFSFFSLSYYKRLWILVKERSNQIDEYSKLIQMETKNVY